MKAILTSRRFRRWSSMDEEGTMLSASESLPVDFKSQMVKRVNITCHPSSTALYNSSSASRSSCGRDCPQSQRSPSRDNLRRRAVFSAGLSELRTNLRRDEDAPKTVVAAISRYLYLCQMQYHFTLDAMPRVYRQCPAN